MTTTVVFVPPSRLINDFPGSPRQDRALVRKLDFKLIPWLCLLYLVSFLDRKSLNQPYPWNVGNEKIEGLIDDLGMTAGQYNACYSIFESLLNVLLKRMRPRIYIPTIMVLWGLCMTCCGMMAARWLLGLTEAGLFPAAVSGSFGGLLAAAISQMDGVGGKRGWAWIFILEGLATVVISVISFWIHDFPDDAKFLSPIDRVRVLKRLRADQQSSAEHEDFQMKCFWQSMKDWKTYVGALIYMGVLLSVPPYALACILTILIGWAADRTNQRGLFNICVSFLGILGFGILIGSRISNTEGVYKRGVTLGMVISWGNLNGVMSSNVYLARDSPRYTMGHAIILGYLAIGLENEKRRNGERDNWIQGKTPKEIEILGDERPDFLYTL
ncbi:major facilitator superfamily domain-containing protein [Trichophaea hybrida]|nr:major facilitator superfamily domain-containing protein [Trichophaea hybrida]